MKVWRVSRFSSGGFIHVGEEGAGGCDLNNPLVPELAIGGCSRAEGTIPLSCFVCSNAPAFQV
jgi:hypothetical protein